MLKILQIWLVSKNVATVHVVRWDARGLVWDSVQQRALPQKNKNVVHFSCQCSLLDSPFFHSSITVLSLGVFLILISVAKNPNTVFICHNLVPIQISVWLNSNISDPVKLELCYYVDLIIMWKSKYILRLKCFTLVECYHTSDCDRERYTF